MNHVISEQTRSCAFELKGRSQNIITLHILETDNEILIAQLKEQLSRSASFFSNTPVVLELSAIAERNDVVDFELLVSTLKQLGLVPIGIQDGNELQQQAARRAHLNPLEIASAPGQSSSPKKTISQTTRVITSPVRSGQRITAPGDLVIFSSVNSGAEVLAEGSIHIYGALCGRALAGGMDNLEARLFCLQFNPELFAIAGHYLVNDDIAKEKLGKTALVSFNGQLTIEVMGKFTPEN
ncbi:MAG: septum site-determining protein MinC [Desulfobacteraceae bacterium 4572_35.1]|nr:MAG: septum site-determining protein MinC [Desulfobacteraceae bacterium 4572_35.1]